MSDQQKRVVMGAFAKAFRSRLALSNCNMAQCPQQSMAYKALAATKAKAMKKWVDKMFALAHDYEAKKVSAAEYARKSAAIKAGIRKINDELFDRLETQRLNDCSVVQCKNENVAVIKAAATVSHARCKHENKKDSCDKEKLYKQVLKKKPFDGRALDTFGKNIDM